MFVLINLLSMFLRLFFVLILLFGLLLDCEKKLVGGICLGLFVIIICLFLVSELIASQTVIWDALLKIIILKSVWLVDRNWVIDKGDIIK